jgi:hypothetical protein
MIQSIMGMEHDDIELDIRKRLFLRKDRYTYSSEDHVRGKIGNNEASQYQVPKSRLKYQVVEKEVADDQRIHHNLKPYQLKVDMLAMKEEEIYEPDSDDEEEEDPNIPEEIPEDPKAKYDDPYRSNMIVTSTMSMCTQERMA